MRFDVRDFLFFIGLALMGYGLWLKSPELAYTVIGGILAGFGMFIWILGVFLKMRRPK